MFKMANLDKLRREVNILKSNLPKVLNKDTVDAVRNNAALENENKRLKQQLERMMTEKEHWHSRCEAALAEMESEKEEKFSLRCELQELVNQMSQQLEYCSSMGAACSTLLWRVSRCEDSIQAILGGTKVDEFLSLISNTIESYISTYSDTEDFPQENAEETQFILALCGIITNIAASPIGRDFVMRNSNGVQLVDTLISTLTKAPSAKCVKLKNLILMALYNMSINQKGMEHLSSSPGFISLLAWQLQDQSDAENRLHSLRLIQSLLYEENQPTLIAEAKEVLTTQLLQDLASDRCRELREAALELMRDLKSLNTEQ